MIACAVLIGLGATSASSVAATGDGSAQHPPSPCKVQDISGTWGLQFSDTTVPAGLATLVVTQDGRRVHISAFANDGSIADGNGTISASGNISFHGEGAGFLQEISAHGSVQNTCFPMTGQFDYTAIYLTGPAQGTGNLLVHVPAGQCLPAGELPFPQPPGCSTGTT
jgi:hypothetical protein